MNSMTSNRVRPLSLEDLGVTPIGMETVSLPAEEEIERLPDDNEVLTKVRAALEMGFAGVILSGPPGTGKSWYAKRIAHTIAGEPEAIRIVQFHTSYQYEDFMEGFAPKDGGGFELQKKSFPLLCEDATERPDIIHVLLIDEISRCDVARVFGEALTYMEVDKRGLEFTLASGSSLVVPRNLVILATMNPWDKGVDELDVALERRFAQIDMLPDVLALRAILADKGADRALIDRVAAFFEGVQKLDDEMVRLGHAYFNNCIDEASARRAWDFRLFPFFKKACRLDKDMLSEIIRMWLRSFPPEGGIGDGGAILPTVEDTQLQPGQAT
ncbi:McrB family protein [Mesorhizobium muleiense]|uniref:5-methylcytosine-specific restriction enzyme B n=1 Tax=Mesorhizobium muleiense TaxID=1004279 RepID=A0A1G9AAI3_9HYPH|nr:AAA family ATPase [Mesorhizobium muleiense]MCF6101770.1 AAA family ATPase [Mesorhizobium muleiense]SDK24273.1 5-methylcytosine-specific restriction enzyme B [Mesorhizobium muleiense]